MARIDAPNSLADPDAFYEALVALHDGRDPEQSLAVYARLILLMAQHIGDDAVLRELLAAAAGATRER